MNNFENRRYILLLIYLTVAFIFLLRISFMQLFTEKWHTRAAKISELKIYTYAPRGIMYDRYGNKLVENKTFYDLLVIPNKMKSMDTAAFCTLIGITREHFDKKLQEAKDYSRYIPSEFEKQISSENFATISEELYRYPGFFAQERTMRGYRKEIGAHIFGYVGEVSKEDIEDNPYYKKRDYIGKSGIEKTYEEQLRGRRGVRYLLKDAIGKESGSFADGKYDTLAVPGENLYTSIDPVLQEYGEKLMQNKKGSIVCIEPETGEILALVSSPTYNPSLMTGRESGKNYQALVLNDTLNPLFNRATHAMYPPGSIFKMAQALIGLEEGVINFETGFPCDKSLVGCHNHPGASDLKKAIQYSCNPYFFRATQRIIQQGKAKSFFKDAEMGLRIWTKYMNSFGFGNRLDADIAVKGGFIPHVDFYNARYGKHRWAYTTIYSISIGQGEVLVIPLQMANFTAIIANRGYFYSPHFIRGIGQVGNVPEKYKKKNMTMVRDDFFEPLIEAMRAVVEEPGGTARSAKIPGITVCGKTGTAQNPQGEDHSVFIAFAPMDKPKIAISVYVENAGFGGTWAAPIASLMMEKYLTGSVTDTVKEKRMMDAVILDVQKELATKNKKKIFH
jgi:penicillin-binding protein 2